MFDFENLFRYYYKSNLNKCRGFYKKKLPQEPYKLTHYNCFFSSNN